MGWQFTVLSLPILLAVAVSLVILGYLVTFYRDRYRDPVVALYFCVTIAALVWTGFSALKLLHTDPTTKLLFYRLLHIGAATLPPLLFLFVVAFTDRTRWLRYDFVGAIFLVPSAFLVLLFFGPSGLITGGTQLIEDDLIILRVANSLGFRVFLLYSALLVVATLGIVVFEIRRIGSTYYRQALSITVAAITPMVFSAFTSAGIPPFVDDSVNLVPTAGAVSVLASGVLLYRYHLVDLPPLAHATAMKYSPDTLFVLNGDGRVVSANEHGSDLLEALNGRMGAPLSEVIPEFDPESPSNDLIELTPSSGERSYYRVFVEPLTRGGERVGWVVVLRDETAQQRQQKRLEQKTEQLELFASTVSHDLRNPLSVAQGNLQLAQEEFDSEQLDTVESAHDRMGEIIEEVLTLARAGQQIDELEPVLIEIAANRAWENVTTGGTELTVETDRTVMADPAMIQHVFENLFRNAVEHGGQEVQVRVGNLENGIYVEDDGTGIPPDKREDVFDVGYTGTSDGTGLGLGIINQVVEAHEWEIRLLEGTDGGARFEITGVEVAESTL
jgi:signal transduction histidine kinase